MEYPHINVRIWNAVLGYSLKNRQNDFSFLPRQTIQHHSNPSLCPNHWCRRSWSWLVVWRPQDLLELTSKKDVLFIIGDWNAKRGNQEIWSNRQVWPWSTKWSRAKANRVLSREHTGHSKHPFPATQVMTLHMDIIQRSIPTSDDYILCSWRSSSSIQPAKQDLDLTAAQVMSSLLKNSGFNWRKYGKPLGYSGMT